MSKKRMNVTFYRAFGKSLRNIFKHHENYLSLQSLIRCQFPPGMGLEIVTSEHLERTLSVDVEDGTMSFRSRRENKIKKK